VGAHLVVRDAAGEVHRRSGPRAARQLLELLTPPAVADDQAGHPAAGLH
jgi:hypothetical protein